MQAKRILKKILKVFLWVAVSIVGLLLLISVAIYLPPVQNFIKDKAAKAVSASLGMELSISRIRLRFPLSLQVYDTRLVTAQGDTLASVGTLGVNVAVAPLLRGNIEINKLSLEDAAVDYRDTLSDMRLSGTLGNFTITNTNASLKEATAEISRATLERANISLELGESPAVPDTVPADTSSLAWIVDLRRLNLNDVNFSMHTRPQVTELTAHLEKGRLRNLSVDLGRGDVTAGLLQLDDGVYAYLFDTTTMLPAPAPEPSPADSLTQKSLTWTVNLARLEINDNAFRYGSLYGDPSPGFDPSHIELDDITLRIDSIYNRGAALAAVIRTLSANERSGLQVTDAQGRFSMDSARIVIDGFDLRTPNSHLQAQAEAGGEVLDMSASAPLQAKLSAEVGMRDVFLFYPAGEALQNTLKGKPLSVDGEISGTLGDISVGKFRAQLARNIDLSLRGNIRSVMELDRLAGNINVSGKFEDLDMLKGLLPDTALRARLGFPALMELNGSLAMGAGAYKPDLVLTADSGRLTLAGELNTRTENYTGGITLEEFPLGTFLPHDSLGFASLTLTAEGSGFDPTAENAAAHIETRITHFGYNGIDFSGIALSASLEEHIINGNLTGKNDALDLRVDFDGEVSRELYAAKLHGEVAKADLYAMGLSPSPLDLALDIEADASANIADTAYRANLALDSVKVAYGQRTQRIGKTTLEASADASEVKAQLQSGDLRLNFTSKESISGLAEGFGAVASEAIRQIDSLDIDMNPIQQIMPEFRLDFLAGRNNALREYLRTTGMDFNKLSVTAANDGTKPFGAGIVVNGLRSGSLTLDTLNVWLLRRDTRLAYALRLRNRPGNIEQMAFIGAGGDISGNTARISLIQHDRADSVGFRFGVTAELLDSAVKATLTPLNPVFGYRKWSVNEGNYLTYHFDKRIEGDLRLEGTDSDQFFRITSVEQENMPPGSVRLDIGGIELGEVFSLFPSPMPIAGVLKANGAIGLSGPIVKGNLALGVDGLSYEGQKVGDISLGATANTDPNNIWNLDLQLAANGQTALTARGTYDVMKTGALDMAVSVPGLQLELANAFLPADILRLSGKAHGQLNVGGTVEKLKMEGGINFENSKMTVPMIGTTFGISDQRISIGNNRVSFRDFGLTAPNRQKLSLDGSLDIADFSAIGVNLRLFASNFEAVNSQRSGGSQVYGRGVLDVDMSARGLLDALTIRGNVNILSQTDIYYTMRDSPLEVADARQDIVTFLSFADEETWAQEDSVPLRRQSSIDVLVNVDIQDNVEATVNLSENGNNRIELIGDGALSFTMNNQGDIRLTGRYTLSGGTVVYNPPVISQKTFGIDDGSYVEWTGELANPSFNIVATESEPVRVASADESTQLVNFDIIVTVSNSLENMAITFDLSAPNNGDIQNYLMSLAPEQRASQAMYMLITNSYLGDGSAKVSSDFDVNQQIGSFISKELNQWARNNLSGVDISVGIDSVEDEGGAGSHMDYSYSVSKSLFDDRVKVTIGGSVSDGASADVTENLVDDISLEYRLTKRDNMFLKVYRYNTQESILDGEVTETGVGFVLRKKMNKLRELFRLTPDPQKRRERQNARELRRELREDERLEIDSLRRLNSDSLPPARGLFNGPRRSDGEKPVDEGQIPAAGNSAAEALPGKDEESQQQ